DLIGLGHLPRPAIDQQHVGQDGALAGRLVPCPVLFRTGDGRAPEAPGQRLVHRGVVVTRLDATDVEAAVLAAYRTLGIEHHARGDGRLAHGVADVEAFDAAWQLRQDRK